MGDGVGFESSKQCGVQLGTMSDKFRIFSQIKIAGDVINNFGHLISIVSLYIVTIIAPLDRGFGRIVK